MLYLGSEPFETHQPIRVTVTLPASALRAVYKEGPGDVLVAPGFNVSTFTATSAGTGVVAVRGMKVDKLTLRAQGCGGWEVVGRAWARASWARGVQAQGEIGSLEAETSGTGDVYADGVRGPVQATLSGTGSLSVGAAAGAQPTITGTSSGLGGVYFTAGQCTLTVRGVCALRGWVGWVGELLRRACEPAHASSTSLHPSACAAQPLLPTTTHTHPPCRAPSLRPFPRWGAWACPHPLAQPAFGWPRWTHPLGAHPPGPAA